MVQISGKFRFQASVNPVKSNQKRFKNRKKKSPNADSGIGEEEIFENIPEQIQENNEKVDEMVVTEQNVEKIEPEVEVRTNTFSQSEREARSTVLIELFKNSVTRFTSVWFYRVTQLALDIFISFL